MSCPTCSELCVRYRIDSPGDLSRAIKIVSESVKNGTLREVNSIRGRKLSQSFLVFRNFLMPERSGWEMMSLLRIAFLLFACIPGLVGAESLSKAPDVVAGTYSYRTDAESVEQLGDAVCFYPRSGSRFRHTRPSGDRRIMWFCFANVNDAKRMLGIPPAAKINECGLQGQATVEIDEHQTAKQDTDDVDVVRLVAVRNVSKTRSIGCPH